MSLHLLLLYFSCLYDFYCSGGGASIFRSFFEDFETWFPLDKPGELECDRGGYEDKHFYLSSPAGDNEGQCYHEHIDCCLLPGY